MKLLLALLFVLFFIAMPASAEHITVTPAASGGGGAPSASPTFTGTVTMPDGSTWNSTNLALAPAGTTTNPTLAFTTCGTNCGWFAPAANQIELVVGGTNRFDWNISTPNQFQFNGTIQNNNNIITTAGNILINGGNGNIQAGQNGAFQWNALSTFLTSPGSAQIQFGAFNGAAPVAQTLKFQSGSGTNISGQNTTIIGSLSTGTGTDGDIIFQTGIKNGGSNSTPAIATTAITVKGETQEAIFAAPVRLKGYTVSGLPTGNQGDTAFVTDQLTTCAGVGAALTGGGAKVCPVFFDGSAWVGG